MSKLRVLELFAGIGGFSLGLERTGGFETVAFCEIDPFCQKVLRKHWPDVPIYDDVRTLDADRLGRVDIITGGYPCQPFSLAGKRDGEEDDRHLWPAMRDLVEALGPTWVIGENVAGHISMGLDAVLSDLEALGYACQPFVIPACAVDAPHRRDRIWTVANAGQRRRGGAEAREVQQSRRAETIGAGEALANTAGTGPHAGSYTGVHCEEEGGRPRDAEPQRRGENVADTDQQGPQGHGRLRKRAGQRPSGALCRAIERQWLPEPPVGRVASGIPRRVDRLRALGNAIVPKLATALGYAILEADEVMG